MRYFTGSYTISAENTFIFINKMDQPGTDRESLLTELKERLDEGCIVFGKGKNVESLEEIAMTDEAVLDYFMEHETVRNEDICRLIRERKIFPCYFGSALRRTSDIFKGDRR